MQLQMKCFFFLFTHFSGAFSTIDKTKYAYLCFLLLIPSLISFLLVATLFLSLWFFLSSLLASWIALLICFCYCYRNTCTHITKRHYAILLFTNRTQHTYTHTHRHTYEMHWKFIFDARIAYTLRCVYCSYCKRFARDLLFFPLINSNNIFESLYFMRLWTECSGKTKLFHPFLHFFSLITL